MPSAILLLGNYTARDYTKMTDKLTYLDHERIKRLPPGHQVLNELAKGLKDVMSGEKTFEDLITEKDDA